MSQPPYKLQLTLKASARCLAFSPDDQLLASGSEDGTIRLWYPTTGLCLRTLSTNNPKYSVSSIAFAPNGQLLASAGSEGYYEIPSPIRLWNLVTGELPYELSGHRASLEDVTFSPHGQLLASAGEDGTIRLWW